MLTWPGVEPTAAADEAHWSADLTDDEPPEIVFYCLECAAGEFGGD